MKNNWVAQLRKPFALWTLSLPSILSPLDLEQVFAFTDAFEALGHTYEIFEIEKEGHNKYSDHIKETSKQTKRLPFFDFGLEVDHAEIKCSGKICYFTKTGIAQKKVADVGALLVSLIEEEGLDELDEQIYKYEKPYYTKSVAPVSLTGNSPWMPIDSNKYRSRAIIDIELYTDIWFPWVSGALRAFQARKQSELFDNRQLAQCHTTRLNDFLADAKKLTLEYGGTWDCVKERDELVESMYIDMIYETGINLQWEK